MLMPCTDSGLNMEAYEQAQDVRMKRQKVDEAIRSMAERKAKKAGGGSAQAASLSVADFASEGLRLRTEMQRAVEQERWMAPSLQGLLHYQVPVESEVWKIVNM